MVGQIRDGRLMNEGKGIVDFTENTKLILIPNYTINVVQCM